jgi:transposase
VQLSKHDLAQLDEAALAALTPEQLHALSLKLLADLKLALERLEQNPRNSSRPPSSVAPWERFGQHDDADDGETDPAEDAVQAPAADAHRPDPIPAGDAYESGAASAADQPAQAAEPPDASAQTKPGAGDEPSPRRRPGRQPGAPGHGRTQHLPIDHEVTHAPSHCARCGDVLEASAATRCVSAHRVLELREAAPGRHVLEVIEIKHVYYERDCGCGHCTRAEPGHTRRMRTGA